jgi:YD repeat-containing protein
MDDIGKTYTFDIGDVNGNVRLRSVTEDSGKLDGRVYKYSYNGSGKLEWIKLWKDTTLLSAVQYVWGNNYLRGVRNNGDVPGQNYLNVTYDSSESSQVSAMQWGSQADSSDRTGYVSESFSTNPNDPRNIFHIDTNGMQRSYCFDPIPEQMMLCRKIVLYDAATGAPLARTYFDYMYEGKVWTENRITRIKYPMGNEVHIAYAYNVDHSDGVGDKRGFANITMIQNRPGDRANLKGGVVANYAAPMTRMFQYYGEDQYYQLQYSCRILYPNVQWFRTNYYYEDVDRNLTGIKTQNEAGGYDATLLRYNEYGQLIRTRDPAGGVTVYEYNGSSGYLEWTSESKNPFGIVDFDSISGRGDIIERVDYHVARDNYGRPTAVTNPSGGQTVYVYDDMGRLEEVYLPVLQGGARRQIDYINNAYRDRVERIDQHNPVPQGTPAGYSYSDVVSTTQFFYDGLDRLWKKIVPVHNPGDSGEILMEYYGNMERLAYVRQNNGSYDHICYDNFGRIMITVHNDNDNIAGNFMPDTAHAVGRLYNTNDELVEIDCKYTGYPLDLNDWHQEVGYQRDWAGRAAQVFDLIHNRTTQSAWNGLGLLYAQDIYSNSLLVSSNSYGYYDNGDPQRVVNNITGAATTFAADRQLNSTRITDTLGYQYADHFNPLGLCDYSWNAGIDYHRFFDDDGNLTQVALGAAPPQYAPSASYDLTGQACQVTVPELEATTNILASGAGVPGVVRDPMGHVANNIISPTGMPASTVEDVGVGGLERGTSLSRSREQGLDVLRAC